MAAHFGQGLAGRPIGGRPNRRLPGRLAECRRRNIDEGGHGVSMVTDSPPDQAPRASSGAVSPARGMPARDLGLRIARDGDWLYRGSPIHRMPLVKLFASVLRREADGSYWLVTPGRARPDRGRGRAVRRDRARPDRTGGRAAAALAHQSRRVGPDRAAASDPPAPAHGRARKAPGPRPMSRSATGSRRGSRERSTTSWSTSPRSGSSRAGPGSACGARAISSRSTSRVPEDRRGGPGADPCGDRRSPARRPAGRALAAGRSGRLARRRARRPAHGRGRADRAGRAGRRAASCC